MQNIKPKTNSKYKKKKTIIISYDTEITQDVDA